MGKKAVKAGTIVALILLSIVAIKPAAQVAKANPWPGPSSPTEPIKEPPIITIQSPTEITYSQNSIALNITIIQPESWLVNLTGPPNTLKLVSCLLDGQNFTIWDGYHVGNTVCYYTPAACQFLASVNVSSGQHTLQVNVYAVAPYFPHANFPFTNDYDICTSQNVTFTVNTNSSTHWMPAIDSLSVSPPSVYFPGYQAATTGPLSSTTLPISQTTTSPSPNATEVSAVPSIVWQHSYSTGGSGFSGINVMIQTADGGYSLAGSAMALILGDIGPWLIKTDATGNQQWMQFYFANGSNPNMPAFNVNLPGAYAVVQMSDGGYLMAGGEYLTRTHAEGKMMWRQSYNEISISATHLWSLVNAAEGDCVVAGLTAAGKCWLGEVNSKGALEWNRTYPLTCIQSFVVKTGEGGYVVAGYSYLASQESSAFIFGTDSVGNMLWNRTFGGSLIGFQVFSLAAASDGGFALAGINFTSTDSIATLVKTDSLGNVEWSQTYDGQVDPGQGRVIQTDDGGYAFGYGVSLVKTDPSGNLQWTLPLDVPVCSIVQTNDGGLVIAGSSSSSEGWLAKTSSILQTFPQTSTSTPATPQYSPTPTSSPTNAPAPTLTLSPCPTPTPSLSPSSSPMQTPAIEPSQMPEGVQVNDFVPVIITGSTILIAIVAVGLLTLLRKRRKGYRLSS